MGMSMELRQQLPGGGLADASGRDFDLVKTKANIATIAKNLQSIEDDTEKTRLAVELKDYANALYSEGLFEEAMGKYVESLAAANFSSDVDKNNVDALVVPVLTNLAACTIQLKQWCKGAEFCRQALKLRPGAMRARLRLGICLLHEEEFEESIESLEIVASSLATKNQSTSHESQKENNENIETKNSESQTNEEKMSSSALQSTNLELGPADCARVPMLLSQAREGLERARKREQKFNKALRAEFQSKQKPLSEKAGGISSVTLAESQNKSTDETTSTVNNAKIDSMKKIPTPKVSTRESPISLFLHTSALCCYTYLASRSENYQHKFFKMTVEFATAFGINLTELTRQLGGNINSFAVNMFFVIFVTC